MVECLCERLTELRSVANRLEALTKQSCFALVGPLVERTLVITEQAIDDLQKQIDILSGTFDAMTTE